MKKDRTLFYKHFWTTFLQHVMCLHNPSNIYGTLWSSDKVTNLKTLIYFEFDLPAVQDYNTLFIDIHTI